MAPSRDIILTHGDLDGMVSAILLLQRLQADTPIQITNGEKLATCLEKLGADSASPTTVWITDIPLVTGVAAQVQRAISALADAGGAVHIYDHHLGWESRVGQEIGKLCTTFVVAANKTTAAAIVWSRFLRGARESQRWLQLLSERERSDDVGIRRDFAILAALTQRQHWKLQNQALHELASGQSPSPPIEQLADWYYGKHRPREQAVAERAEVFVTQGARRIGWLDLRAEDAYLLASRDVIQQHGVDLTATVIAKGVVLGGERIDGGVDLTALHGRHEVNGVLLDVAGHKSPVRLSPVDGRVDGKFLAAVRTLIEQTL